MNDKKIQKEEQEETEKQVLPVQDSPAKEDDSWDRFIRKTVVYYIR